MIANAQIEKDLFGMPEQFKEHMRRKEYAQAKYCYDTARTVALFVHLEQDKLLELFGSRQTDPPAEGLFPELQVQKAYEECAVRRRREEREVARDRRKRYGH